MDWLKAWWCILSDAERASVIGAVIAAVFGVVIGIVVWGLFGVPKLIAWHYKRVLIDLEDSENEIKLESGPNKTIPELEVIKRSGHYQWMVRRAKKWERILKRFPD